MFIKNTYPIANGKGVMRKRYLKYLGWPFIIGTILSILINLIIGGLWLSLIVVFGLYIVWHLILEIDLVEYNRISQFIKATIYSCILMFLIDTFLIGGWALDVISIVSFASVIISGLLFFTDLNRQKQNMLPMLFLMFIAIVWSIVGLLSALEIKSWTLIVLGSVTIALLCAIIITLRGDFLREIKCRLHIK